MSEKSILEEASEIIKGDRREAYGPVEQSFKESAAIWSVVLKTPVTPQQVALCMIGLKLQREANSAKRDNRTDLLGYTLLLDQLYADT